MLNEKILKLYDQIIQELSHGNRSLPKLDEDFVKTIIEDFNKSDFSKLSPEITKIELSKIFCILTNTQTTSYNFHSILQKSYEIIIKHKLSGDIYVLFLSALQKQVIEHSSKTGDRIPTWSIDLLKDFLKTHDPEVLEWTLRTIESLGIESLKFQNDIKKLRPNILKIFNTHQRHAFEIIELLDKQWARIKR